MAITEPTGWELSCDSCGTRLHTITEPLDRQELEDWARRDGWLLLINWHYCSIKCADEAVQR